MNEPTISPDHASTLPPSATAEDSTPPANNEGETRDADVTLSLGPSSSIDGSGNGVSAASRFSILHLHAKGGLGQVSVALDQELNRHVALKEIQSHLASDVNCRSRFVLEAEVTGGLEHPGIVPVYGLGQYADGRPYYAMRFIKGDSLKEAVDGFHCGLRNADCGFESLEFRKLLGRFIDVCNAIEYAHSRGVLHRDLKPGNIMLGKYGETLVVDWGLAKVVGRDETASPNAETTLQPTSTNNSTPTMMGTAMGTPAYMSPEQAAGRLDQLGPATDVYSLGATLYAVLTGRAPIEAPDRAALFHNIATGKFPRPRERNRAIPAALEAICLKAMALEPKDRYASARTLADDVEKWLADEPVSAFRAPLSDRIRRWGRKHRTAVASVTVGAAVMLIALAGALGLTARHNVQLAVEQQKTEAANGDLRMANEQERLAKADADTKRRQAEEAGERERLANVEAQKKRGEAEKARDETKQVLDYLVASFRKPDPSKDGEKLTVAELFGQAAEQLEVKFPKQPLIQAELLNAIGRTYFGLGLYEKAIVVYERARDLSRAELGEEHPGTLKSLTNLAVAYQSVGRLDDALPLLEQALELGKAKVGPEHQDTLQSMNNLAVAYGHAGRLVDAVPLYERTVELQKAKFGPDSLDVLTTMNNLAVAYQSMGRLNEALALLEQITERRKAKLGQDNLDTLTSLNNLAFAYKSAGRLADALPVFEQTHALLRAKLGPDHPNTITSMGNLAAAYASAGKFDEALPLLESYLSAQRRRLANDPVRFGGQLASVSLHLLEHGQYEAAEPYLRECVAIREQKLPDGWQLFAAKSTLGAALAGQQKFAEAEPLLLDGYQGMKQREAKIPADPNVSLTEAIQRLVDLYSAWDKPEEAAKWKVVLDAQMATVKPNTMP